MGSVMSSIGGFLGASSAWLIAVLVPIARSVAKWTAKRRDFDIVKTALLPSILFVVFSAFLAYGIWSPQSLGTSAIWVWIGYQPVKAVLVLGGLIVLVLLMTAGLLWFGHRCLLAIWRRMPLRRDDNREIPIVDRKGVIAAFAATHRRFARVDSPGKWVLDPLLTSRWAVIKPLAETHRPWLWLSQIELPPNFGGDFFKDATSASLVSDFEQRLKECHKEADRIIKDARALVQSSVSPVKANADKHATTTEPANHAPDPAAVRRIVEDLMDGLSPQFLVRYEALVKAVASFQQEVCGFLQEINDRIDKGDFSHACLPNVRRIIDELQTESRDLAWELALQFGATKEARYSANSLAFNLEATTLGRESYWNPLSRYNWKANRPSTDEEIAKKERRLEKAMAELADIDAPQEQPKVRTVSERTDHWMARSEVLKLIEKGLLSEERSQRSRDRYRKIVETEEKLAARLEVMSAVRSKILAYIAFASVVAACGVLAAVMSLTVFGAANLWESIWSAALAALALFLAVVVARKIFISTVVNHAFYLTMAENRLRPDNLDQERRKTFDWTPRPIGDRARRLIWVGEFAVLFALAVGAHYLVATMGYTDYRLVVAARQPLAGGDGITSRNLDDLVKVGWRRCDPDAEPYRLDDPAKLVDTYTVGRCGNKDALFGRPDLVLRPHAKKHAWAVPASDDNRCLDLPSLKTLMTMDDPDRKPHKKPPPPGMCLTTVNKPPAPGPGWRETLATRSNEILHEMRRQFWRMPRTAPTQPQPRALLHVANISVDAQSMTSIAESRPPIIAYVEKPETPTTQTTTVYAILDGKSGVPEQATLLESIYFDFDCDGRERVGARRRSCGDIAVCKREQANADHEVKPANQRENEEAFARLAKEAALLKGNNRNFIIVGWADRAGGDAHNQGLGSDRATYVREQIIQHLPSYAEQEVGKSKGEVDKLREEAAKLREEVGKLIHTIGIGAGSPKGEKTCQAARRRADVYFIDARQRPKEETAKR